MRDVSGKAPSLRTARASAILSVSPETIRAIKDGTTPKADPLAVARVGATQAAKNTPLLIPYCHSVPLDFVDVEFEIGEREIRVTCFAKAIYRTGVEMEALAGAAAAALNLYDLLKPIDESMEILAVRLESKTGGKSQATPRRAELKGAVIVVSDSRHAGRAEDTAGPIMMTALLAQGIEVSAAVIVPDESPQIVAAVKAAIEEGARIVLTTGGTGLGPRDVTPTAIAPLLDERLDAIEQAVRAHGQSRNPMAMLGRTLAGRIAGSIVICLPGAPAACEEAAQALFPYLIHAFAVMDGGGHDN